MGKVLSMPGAVGFLARHDMEPCGFVIGRIAADEGEIITLGVAPAWRRKGTACLLLQAFLGEVSTQGARSVFLEVAEDNSAALTLYAAAEFKEAGRRTQYYRRDSGRIDALVLRKSI